MSTVDRTTEGRFRPGQSGNPAGRPVGARNKTMLALEALLDGQAEGLTKRLVDEAQSGNLTALRICFDRLAPRRKGQPVPFDLPRLESTDDAIAAATAIIAGVAAGELTALEGADLMKLIDTWIRVRKVSGLERRVVELEEALALVPETTGGSTGDGADRNADESARPSRPQASPERRAPEITGQYAGHIRPESADAGMGLPSPAHGRSRPRLN
jgi:hypothetical protein